MDEKILNIKVIVGSTREGRFGDKPATWIIEQLNKQNNIKAEILDLRDYAMPFFDSPVSPAYKQEPYTNEAVAKFTKKIAEGDAFVIVTPEYNHSTSGVLKNALDWVYQEWGNKPVGFISYGSVGGSRAVEHLRMMAVELQMAPIREAVHFMPGDVFPVIMGKADATEMFSKYQEKADNMINQLLKWTRACAILRSS